MSTNKSEGEHHGSTAVDAVKSRALWDIRALQSENKSLKAQVSSLQKERDEARGCLDRANKLTGAQADENAEIVRKLEAQVSSLQSSLKKAEEKIKELEEALSEDPTEPPPFTVTDIFMEKARKEGTLKTYKLVPVSPSPQKEVAPLSAVASAKEDRSKPSEVEELRGIKWLIWSNEHELWWSPDSKGYTPHIKEAGRYSLDEALDICQDKLYRRKLHNIGTEIPAEVMVPSPELIEVLQAEGKANSTDDVKLPTVEDVQAIYAEGNATPTEKTDNSQNNSLDVPLEIAEGLYKALNDAWETGCLTKAQDVALAAYDKWKEQQNLGK